MRVLAGCLAGLLSGAIALRSLAPVLSSPVLARDNHRGRSLPTAGGLAVVVAVLAAEAMWTLVDVLGEGVPAGDRRLVVLAVAAFGLLGLVDDLVGSGADGRGFAGHLRAMTTGRLTTGGLKLVGGGAVALVVCATGRSDAAQVVADAFLVALAANLGNLFDRAPGRVTKLTLLAVVALTAASGADDELAGVAMVAGALTATLVPDLRERLMLGDTGANVAGAVAGLGAVIVAPTGVRFTILVVVALLNLASEAVSFSAVIDRVGPLRWFDRLGRAT